MVSVSCMDCPYVCILWNSIEEKFCKVLLFLFTHKESQIIMSTFRGTLIYKNTSDVCFCFRRVNLFEDNSFFNAFYLRIRGCFDALEKKYVSILQGRCF